jgi:mono/diheme cytochrome c family protein
MERQIVQIPLNARIKRQMMTSSPIPADEGNLLVGAQIYRDQCATCHGFYGKPSSFAAHMYPAAPQLWQKRKNSSSVGASSDPPGEIYWKVNNGIRLTGMPAFNVTLTDTQIWQVTLLLTNADKPLPPAVIAIVRGQSPLDTTANAPVLAPASK